MVVRANPIVIKRPTGTTHLCNVITMDMQSVEEKLITHWQADGLAIQSGVTGDQISSFEKKYQVVMPSDLKSYFLQVNGMKTTLNDCKDKEGFSFWSLSEVKTVELELNQVRIEPYATQNLESFFVFVDYFDWSWAYAIYLSSEPTAQNQVILIGKEHPIKIADSFTAFVDLYISNSAKLYGRGE